jgi:hypothetical protein
MPHCLMRWRQAFLSRTVARPKFDLSVPYSAAIQKVSPARGEIALFTPRNGRNSQQRFQKWINGGSYDH